MKNSMGDLNDADKAAVCELWFRRAMLDVDAMFAHAEVAEAVVRENETAQVGMKVFVTMISRFGDVGFRTDHLDEVRHGYTFRCDPRMLRNYRFVRPLTAEEQNLYALLTRKGVTFHEVATNDPRTT